MIAFKELFELESVIHHIVSATAFYACTVFNVLDYEYDLFCFK